MNNRKLILTLGTIATIAYLFADLDMTSTTSVPGRSTPPSGPLPRLLATAPAKDTPTTPSPLIFKATQGSVEATEKRIIMTKTKTVTKFKTRSTEALPPGLKLASEIFAVKQSEFSPRLGEKLEDRDGLIYFQAVARPGNVANVVVDERTGRLHAVSSIIKVSNVDEALREGLLAKGLQEHYYSEELRVLYLQTTAEEVFELHAELARENLHPELEINRARRRIR